MLERIICRFRNEDDLTEFANRNGFSLNKYVKEYNIHTHERKIKKQTNKSDKIKEEWKYHWKQMPLYASKKQYTYAKIEFIFRSNDLCLANDIFCQNITNKTKSVWYPKLIQGSHSKHRVVCGNAKHMYPIYVVSKGRHDKCFTSNFLTLMEVDHYVVVEPQDIDLYKKNVENDYAEILELDMYYKNNYDRFSSLGRNEDDSNTGPGAARNFCWDHSIKNGFEWHWVMDDNANEGFHYMYNNKKIKCRSGAWFRACEDFVTRYSNIAQAGLNYSKFCKESDKTPPYVLNTRIYSFLLIKNDLPYRWRGRYNEDTDLSLRILKDGWCTIQFNAFLAGKATTQKIKGGNTEEFYKEEGTWNKSKMLEDMHPDVAKLVWKFNRWHHEVNYKCFKQGLILKDEYKYIADGINNYGMKIISTDEKSTSDSKSYLENKYQELLNT